MLTIRTLSPSEYARLGGIMPNDDWIPNSSTSVAIVAERDDEIIGFWIAQPVIHTEPVWIKRGERNGLVLGLMWRRMHSLVKRIGTVFAFSPSDETSCYLKRLGFTEQKTFTVFSRKGES